MVTEAKALLAALDRVPGLMPPPARLEEPWHDAAIRLAGICVAYGDPNAAPSWYKAGPAIGFVQRALEEIGCGALDPDAIRQVISHAGL